VICIIKPYTRRGNCLVSILSKLYTTLPLVVYSLFLNHRVKYHPSLQPSLTLFKHSP